VEVVIGLLVVVVVVSGLDQTREVLVVDLVVLLPEQEMVVWDLMDKMVQMH
jgi:hypothetical protein